MSSPICWMKYNIFSDTSQQASKNAKTEELFSRHRKTRQKIKINKCKTCPKKETVFFGDKTEKKD